MDRRTFLSALAAWSASLTSSAAVGSRAFAQSSSDSTPQDDHEGHDHDHDQELEDENPLDQPEFAHLKEIPFKKGIPFDVVAPNGSILDRFQLLKDMGFHGVEIQAPMVGYGAKAITERRTELNDAQLNTGLKIYSVRNTYDVKYSLLSEDRLERMRAMSCLRTMAVDGSIYKALIVRSSLGVVNEKNRYDDAYAFALEDLITRFVKTLDQAKVRLALRTARDNFLLSPLEFRQFVHDAAHPRIGACLDPGNILPYGWPEHWTKILGDHIYSISLSNFSHDKGNKEGFQKGFNVGLLEGSCDWDRFMRSVREVSNDMWFTYAVPPITDVNKAKYLNEEQLLDISSSMDEVLSQGV